MLHAYVQPFFSKRDIRPLPVSNEPSMKTWSSR